MIIWYIIRKCSVYIRPDGYPIAVINGKNIRINKFVHGPVKKGMVVDHDNNDKLDNRKDNLREASPNQNGHNRVKKENTSSKHKGVYHCKKTNRYQAYISFKHKRYYLGSFSDEVEAAKAYNAKAFELYQNFAQLNPV